MASPSYSSERTTLLSRFLSLLSMRLAREGEEFARWDLPEGEEYVEQPDTMGWTVETLCMVEGSEDVRLPDSASSWR